MHRCNDCDYVSGLKCTHGNSFVEKILSEFNPPFMLCCFVGLADLNDVLVKLTCVFQGATVKSVPFPA